MKTSILVLSIMLFFGTTQCQTSDSLKHRFGFLVDFNNYTVNQLGIKYRLSDPVSIFFRVGLFYTNSDYSDFNVGSPSTHIEFKPTIGAEYRILRVLDVSLSSLFYTALSFSKDKTDNRFRPDGWGRSTDVYLGLGFVAEYYFTEQFSLSAYQVIEARFIKMTSSDGVTTSTSKFNQLQLAQTKFTVTFYL